MYKANQLQMAIVRFILRSEIKDPNHSNIEYYKIIIIICSLSFSTLSSDGMAAKRSCPLKSGHLARDVIFTDYYGLSYLRKKARGLLQHYKYVFIIL